MHSEVINEIVLWKMNRYVQLTHQTLDLLNEIDSKSEIIDPELTKILLTRLLQTNGICSPMALAILRFKNPQIYQIIDQRVYRVICGRELRLKTNTEVIINEESL